MENIGCRIRLGYPRPKDSLVRVFQGMPVANIDDWHGAHGRNGPRAMADEPSPAAGDGVYHPGAPRG